ncbi:class I SAM-dependent methyltransferase [Shewanella algae]|uniref:class I SAM-dependent methyltransferase n=1 Tax=Shewanella algae TaxID=38313 RepID=UPI001183AF7C|nr:class I SAM-dependent methyltransferase [Shewanella algae]MBO2635171.1 class I SAM-dependent methyltransferase [Shewanella algae]MBO2656374.1 class I SAM-dependent methyltransferase [Shewanella algae]TVL39975.1 SAM-dependent methyltransferase [Shewanella algae]
MSQNIYDNQGFFDAYAQLPRSVHGLDGAPEWPALKAMLPPLKGRAVVDLGCGYGWFCRAARELGAESVLGIDLSIKMLAEARATTRDEAIEYRQGDLDGLTLPSNSVDLAYSSLALHYLADLRPLFATLYQALKPGGSLVFSTEHPIFTCSPHQGWLVDEAGKRSWAINSYQAEGERSSDWLAKGVIKYHRTLGTAVNALLQAGFELCELNEWGPSAEQIAANPALAEEAERPMLLLVAAQKPLG